MESDTPYPYQFCFCSICRKCTGGAFGCNLMGRKNTLTIRGARHLKRYHARMHTRGGKKTR
ncbi:MAG TPA: GFA family protein, partial [Polyangia bacterium]